MQYPRQVLIRSMDEIAEREIPAGASYFYDFEAGSGSELFQRVFVEISYVRESVMPPPIAEYPGKK